ncbi:DUF6387 family protein [Klebsiella aerogenes]|uniref:DUF6387 family protein n=1 Tax=Klebsiella aerogenes TaxID=548 RepID=UPI000F7D9E7F|nr:DUF6387 family protein [Klebsiella aerogenes]MEB5738605.1 DUF6387 family protein [Klebsiella aerogenes]RSV89322.1 hypothetical protein EGH57_09935 [Klebsiella aerogenes]
MAKATRKDLTWFDINNYDFINSLTLGGLIKELEWRDYLFNELANPSVFFDDEYDIKFNRIFSGDANIEVLSDEERDNLEFINAINEQTPSLRNLYGELPKLPSREGVCPVTFSELSMYGFTAIDQGFFKRDEDYTYLKSNAMLASVTGNLEDCFSSSVLTSIDLDGATDDEIISNLAILLPLWRKQLGLPEQEHVAQKRIGIRTIQKLVSNRVLPILDLLLWGQVNSKEITNPMLSVLVFSDDPKDTQAIKDSIKPFAVEAMSEKYTRLLRLYSNRDTEIASCKLSEVMCRIS